MKQMMRGNFFLAAVFFLCAVPVFPLPGEDIAVNGGIAWERMEVDVTVSLNLASAGLKFPNGRIQGEEYIRAAYPSLIQSLLSGIPVDSSRTVGDFIKSGDLSMDALKNFASAPSLSAPAFSPDLLLLRAPYTLKLSGLGSMLPGSSRPAEILRTVGSNSSPDYTGIIIIASKQLPAHGMRISSLARPCIFPKIWDTEMNLIFEKNMLKSGHSGPAVRYAKERDIFLSTSSGLSEELVSLAGERPLRIIAREVFGKRPTDPVIDREDALLITGNERNRELLREGRLVFVLADEVLNEVPGGN
ncbi:MAG: polymerase [Treponema sp.]|jgi:hypothetical protein|nr:polymerase [Treponema sp.]